MIFVRLFISYGVRVCILVGWCPSILLRWRSFIWGEVSKLVAVWHLQKLIYPNWFCYHFSSTLISAARYSAYAGNVCWVSSVLFVWRCRNPQFRPWEIAVTDHQLVITVNHALQGCFRISLPIVMFCYHFYRFTLLKTMCGNDPGEDCSSQRSS